MFTLDKRLLNFLVIIVLSHVTFWWTFFIFHQPFQWYIVLSVIALRITASLLIFKDYSLSWSKVTQKTFLLKSLVYIAAFCVYLPIFYGEVRFAFLASELFFYIFSITFLMYGYYFVVNKSRVQKTRSVVIYGAGKAGMKLEEEFKHSTYRVKYFVDDAKVLQKRSIDGIQILSKEGLKKAIGDGTKLDLLVIAIPSAPKERIKQIYDKLSPYFHEIRILPSLDEILADKAFSTQLKDISVEDLLARHPQDLDKEVIERFIRGKRVLITGAGGSIGSEISRQCARFGAGELVLLDHSEYNLYTISEELGADNVASQMVSVVNGKKVDEVFKRFQPEIVIHAAAYKHVPLCEANVQAAIENNIIGTKNVVDAAIEHGAQKLILISTDKAVRPTNVMGATKRVCELYAQNSNRQGDTEIVAVRFGNVLGSSGSVIPKFKAQLEKGGPLTVTHPEITRYFMLIPEACELVLQAGAIGRGGEIFILDMGEPVKIVDLAKKMIELSGKSDVRIEFTGLRPGEKLYEELLLEDAKACTQYSSITVGKTQHYDIVRLNGDIELLLQSDDKVKALQGIVPEFTHNPNA